MMIDGVMDIFLQNCYEITNTGRVVIGGSNDFFLFVNNFDGNLTIILKSSAFNSNYQISFEFSN